MANKSSTNRPPEPVAGFILAGGQSRRMGRDKASLPWDQGTLLEHMIRLVSEVASEVHVVGTSNLPDRIPNLGPLGGIATALEAGRQPLNLVVAVDLPLLNAGFLRLLCERLIRTDKQVVACSIDLHYPLCIGLRPEALSVVLQCLSQKRSVQQLIEVAPAEIISERELLFAGHDRSLFTNINTPQDWQSAHQKFREKQGFT